MYEFNANNLSRFVQRPVAPLPRDGSYTSTITLETFPTLNECLHANHAALKLIECDPLTVRIEEARALYVDYLASL